MKRFVTLVALLLCSVVFGGATEYTVQDYQDAGSVIIGYHKGKADAALEKIEETELRVVSSVSGGYVCEWDGEFTFTTLAVLKRLRGEDSIRYAEPNFTRVAVDPVAKDEVVDPFAKIDPECDVWVAKWKTITTQEQVPVFLTLMNVRELGAPREVALYFPESVDLNDNLDAMPDQKMADKVRDTVYAQMEERQGTIDKWVPIKQVPRYDADNFDAPTAPGYYWVNSIADADAPEELLRRTRMFVVVTKKKDGSLAVMQAGSTFAAPLNEYVRWSRGMSIESVTGVRRPTGPQPPVKARSVPVSSLPPDVLRNLERANRGEPQVSEPPEVAEKDVKKNTWYLVERHTGKWYAGIAYNDGAYIFHSIRTDEDGYFQSFQIHMADVKSVRGPLF